MLILSLAHGIMVSEYFVDSFHAVHHGDCVDVLPTLNVQPNLILTSPPYDKLREYGGHGFDFDRVADAIVGIMPEGGVLVWVVSDATVDGSQTGTSFRQVLGFMERGLKLHDTMIYEKSLPNNPTPQRYGQTAEWMFVFAKEFVSTANILRDRPNTEPGRFRLTAHPTGRNRKGKHPGRIVSGGFTRAEYGRRSVVWRYAVGLHHQAPDFLDAHKHPAIFPLALAKDHIATWTNPGDLVLDPMAGSGTVLRAAKDLGRSSIGVEIHEPYIDLIQRRMAQEVLELA